MNDSTRQLRVSLLDLATILYHVHKGAQMEDQVGFEDCERSLDELTNLLHRKLVLVDINVLESSLWSANLMDEVGAFWSPANETFARFVGRVLQYASPEEKLYFDRVYNLIRNKPPKEIAVAEEPPQEETTE